MEAETDRAQTATQLVLTTPPPDDAGAMTADAFDWQAAMAAADGLALYLKCLDTAKDLTLQSQVRILCEYHEDWAVLQDAEAELVSAKHKDSPFGAYTTLYSLLTDGGLAHLFARWYALNKKPTCRLVTTPGLAAGDTHRIESAATTLRQRRLSGDVLIENNDEEREVVLQFVKSLLRCPEFIPEEWRVPTANTPPGHDDVRTKVVRQFLSMLTIQHGNPSRTYVGFAAPSMYVEPILQRIDQPAALSNAVWEAVMALFRARMRAAGPSLAGRLPPVVQYGNGAALSTLASVEKDLSRRIVTVADIHTAIETALSYAPGFVPLTRLPYSSRMALKMSAGSCQDNSVERAEHLRLDYRRYWREQINADPTAAIRRERLSRSLLRASDLATALVVRQNESWGQALWAELQAQIAFMPTQDVPNGMDADLLLGGVCDLSNSCKVWFSPRFDVQAVLSQSRTQGDARS